MLRSATIVSFSLLACAAPHAKRLPDGSYAIECTTQKVCLDRAERQCGPAGYKIVAGQHEQKIAGVPGNEVSVGKDQLQIRCKGDLPASAPLPAEPSTRVATPVPHEPRNLICRPGETQKCVGPGACSGGQACKDDGSGFGPCDCANTSKDHGEISTESKPEPN